MANTILGDVQWGDEGKREIIDVFTAKADVVVRSQGGKLAGSRRAARLHSRCTLVSFNRRF